MQRKQSGFTAVELLITLFVAAAFLIAGYQLFNLIIRDGGATRAESRAANIAYDYMRKYANTSTTVPCVASTPLTNSPISIDGLSNVTVSVTVSCLPDADTSLSKVDVALSYNSPSQTVEYSTYVNSQGAAASDVTTGLVAWFKLNGDTNNSIGNPNGVNNNSSVSSTNKFAQQDMAYSFTGSSSITASSTFNLGTTNVAISCWVYNPSASNHGLFVHVGITGFGIGVGTTTTGVNGSKLVMIYNSVRWIPTTTDIGVGWHHVVMTVDAASVPSAYLDNALVPGSYGGAAMLTPSNSTTIGGVGGSSADFFTGAVDDVRIYNRALTPSDVTALYLGGPK